MAKRVLSVGQCMPDQTTISAFLKRRFEAKIQVAETADEAMAMVHNGPFDLVLVNRVFDADGGSGLDLIKAIKADPTVSKVPVMLVSNHADAQQRAVEAGAEPGFGKAKLEADPTAERLGAFLTE